MGQICFKFHSNMCILEVFDTTLCVDHNVVSQQHALLCRWESFIMFMLFILLIGVAGYSSTGRDRYPSLQPVPYQIF